jgi:murein DD-endopeptidase MepM/ murein hydrolase activator NlpD
MSIFSILGTFSLLVRFTVTLPLVRRAVGATVIVALLAVPQAAQASDPLAAAQAKVTDAINAADAAVGAYNDAQTVYYRLEEQVATTGRTIDRLRGEQHRLAKLAQLRALVAYKGGPSGIDDLVGDKDVMDAARRATLLDRVNARGNEALARLAEVTSDLHAREKSLRKEISRQEHALSDLKARERNTRRAVDDAQRAEQALRDRLAAEKRASEFTAFVAQARAAARARVARTSSSQGGGRAGQVIVRGTWVCPVQGAVSFRDDFGEPRSGGRRHKGNDMFAATGTPLVAVTTGAVMFQGDPLGGLAAYVNGKDGNTYYYAHLNDYVGGARSVKAGELIGHVGSSGNADGGPSHLHFEIRPGGPNGSAIDPYPTLAAHC